MIEPVIEVYFDPCADRNGIQGCFCARLRDYHKLWGNGATPTRPSVIQCVPSFRTPTCIRLNLFPRIRQAIPSYD